MMRKVPRRDKAQRAHGDVIATGNAAPLPSFFRHVLEERNGRQANAAKLLHMPRPGNLVSARARHAGVRVEPGQRLGKSA